MRIGATCDDIADIYKKLTEKANYHQLTECFPGTNFSRDEINLKSVGKDEWVTLEYTPDGRLWSIWSRITFSRGMGPDGKTAIDTLIKRFGAPPLYLDYSQDIATRNIIRNNGHTEEEWRAAWSSASIPWNGSINAHSPRASCKSDLTTSSIVECAMRGTRSWESHLGRFSGIITTTSIKTDIKNEGRAVTMWTRMYDPKFINAAHDFYQKRVEFLHEQSKARDAKLIPNF